MKKDSSYHIMLVHGAGQALEPHEPYITSYAGFYGLKTEIDNLEMATFVWAHPYQGNHFTPYSLFSQYKLYRKEKKLIFSEEVQKSLQQTLYMIKPQNIIAHSLGAYLTINTFAAYDMPKSVKNIVLLLPDIPKSLKIPQIQGVKWINIWSWLDTYLLASALVNQQLPIGLVGSTQNHVKNVFQPLKGVLGHKEIVYNWRYKQEMMSHLHLS